MYWYIHVYMVRWIYRNGSIYEWDIRISTSRGLKCSAACNKVTFVNLMFLYTKTFQRTFGWQPLNIPVF